MAFEVARVHQLICSRVEDESSSYASRNVCDYGAMEHMPSQSCSPQDACLRKRGPECCPHESRSNDQSVEVSTSPVDTSSLSTETDSDDDDELLQCLAQQIADSMLDEELKTNTCTGLQRSGCSQAPDTTSAEYRGGQPSPSNWCKNSWSLGHLSSSSQSSSSVSSQVSSPSSAPSIGYEDAWDTLYAAAGEAVKLSTHEETKISSLSNDRPSQSTACSKTLRGQIPQSRTSGHHGRNASSYCTRKSDELMSHKQNQRNWSAQCAPMHTMVSQGRIQAPQYQRHLQGHCTNGQKTLNNFPPGSLVDSKNVRRNRQTDMAAGLGVRVVFLGAASGRESGTGVFLPRNFVNTPDHRKRNGVPTRAKSSEEGVWPTLQQSMHQTILRQPVVREPCLPTEWTY